jgi:Phosphate-selective porin O and P
VKSILGFFSVLTSILLLIIPVSAFAEGIELFVDVKTKQIFTENGAGRVRLGTALIVSDAPPAPTSARPTSKDAQGCAAAASSPGAITGSAALAASTSTTKDNKPIPTWYEKFSLRGYTQMRYTSLFSHEGAEWFSPTDKTIAPDQTFLIRRGRLILSGDASDHLAMYIQTDLNGSTSAGDFVVQLRDLYGDIALDSKKEFRLRVGQSKVPFGFVNLQSSQNRVMMERPDSINSAAEGERDIGTFLYWAPKDISERFSYLVKNRLKGSGDYGVLGGGFYSGQGLNKSDLNDSLHTVVRASYPFKLDSGQFFEPGIQAYTGKFVPTTKGYELNGDEDYTPSFNQDGVTDQRIGVSAIWYPQPIGFEAEWNVGESPELSSNFETIEAGFVQGGYLQANMKIDAENGIWFPFVRWQYFDGARKFGKNAPAVLINEIDFGAEWSPWPDVEFTGAYTYTFDRTNSNSFPYENLTNGSRLAMQVQLNY